MCDGDRSCGGFERASVCPNGSKAETLYACGVAISSEGVVHSSLSVVNEAETNRKEFHHGG